MGWVVLLVVGLLVAGTVWLVNTSIENDKKCWLMNGTQSSFGECWIYGEFDSKTGTFEKRIVKL